ncbi:MAG: riboflavin biosynthesis protein RibD [SAR324 cluster bacterium]|nr:riboflavin biosynthesis protein RibD [SAR324 cluster bacterium]MBL7035291.1 riboflavin biosynthesis protein RibD [SAR324 cluster bacterium]
MLRALELAEEVRHITGDNPWVGCVIVKDGIILAEGQTHSPGQPHAEADAIRNAEIAGHSLTGSTLYSTVEPCSFQGRTPSCAMAIVEKQIAQVVIAIRDPHPQVNGEGIRLLKEGGVMVTEGLEEQAVRGSLQAWLEGFK